MNDGLVAIRACTALSGFGCALPSDFTMFVALLYNPGCMMNRYSAIAALVDLKSIAAVISDSIVTCFVHIVWYLLNCLRHASLVEVPVCLFAAASGLLWSSVFFFALVVGGPLPIAAICSCLFIVWGGVEGCISCRPGEYLSC